MRHPILTLLLASLSVWFIPSALKSQHKLYETSPICGTQGEFQSYLRSLPLAHGSDEVYLFHFSINACPRCEGVAAQFYDLLPDSVNKVIIIETSSLKNLEAYLNKNPAFQRRNCIADTHSLMRQFIDQSRLKLSVPFVYKVSRISGEVFGIQPFLGMHVDQDAVEDLQKQSTAMQCTEPNSKAQKHGQNSWDYTFPLHPPDGRFDECIVFKIINDRELVVIGNQENRLYFFDLQGKLLRNIPEDPAEVFHYVDSANHGALRKLIRQGIAKSIYLDVLQDKATGDYLIANSLPALQVVYNPVTRDTDIYYDNVANLTRVNPQKGTRTHERIMMSVDSILSGSHLEVWACDSFFINALSKGWPANGTDESELENPQKNPFLDTFYRYAPTFELWTRSGFRKGFGHLPKLYRKFRTGYTFCNARIITDQQWLVHAEVISGEVTVYAKSGLPGSAPAYNFTLFPNKMKYTVPRGIEQYDNKLDYIFSLKEHFTKEKILDCILIDGRIAILSKTGQDIMLQYFSVSGKPIGRFRTTLRHADGIEQCQLFVLRNRIYVAGLFKKNREYFTGISALPGI